MHVDWYSRGVYIINARGSKKNLFLIPFPGSNVTLQLFMKERILSTQYGNGVFAKILIFELFFVS